MFGIRDIAYFTQFLNNYGIDYFFELDGESIDFFREENGMYRHVVMPIETFNAQAMWKNIERLKAGFDTKEDKHGGEQTS